MKKSRKIICEHCGVGYAPQGYAIHQKKVQAQLNADQYEREILGSEVKLSNDKNLTKQYESMLMTRQDFIDSALSVLRQVLTDEEKKDFIIRLTSDLPFKKD